MSSEPSAPTSEVAECVFCAIVDQRAPAREVLRTSTVVAFMPDVPAVAGHTLIVPRRHIPDIRALDSPTAHALADATRFVSDAAYTVNRANGLNVIQSNGAAAGQSVFHLHIHVVPRTHGDRMPALWPPDAQWSDDQLDAQAHALARELASTSSKFYWY